jgi:copper resistance protein D
LDDLLISVRAVHFAATISICGVVIFQAFVGEPAFRVAVNGPMARLVRRRLAHLAWWSLALAVLSSVAWLIVQSAEMSERALTALFSEDVLGTVLFDTDFGRVWLARSALIALLAAALYPSYFSDAPLSLWRRGVALTAAAAFVAALAFAGHAAASTGIESLVKEASDVLHLLAAASWVGALTPLAMVLGAAGSDPRDSSLAIARAATLWFSTLGIVSVATVLASGIVNTWVLVGSVPALIGTDYGRLLLVKISLFLVMLSVATVNRLRLTPRLSQDRDHSAERDALRQLRTNSVIEVGIGAVILGIVGVLGTLPPGNEQTGYEAASAIASASAPGLDDSSSPGAARHLP